MSLVPFDRAPQPSADTVTDAIFKKVEAEIMELHSKRFGGPPNDRDPRSLLEHLLWWRTIRPPGDIADNTPEEMARNVIVYGACTRLVQRVKVLPEPSRVWLNKQLNLPQV